MSTLERKVVDTDKLISDLIGEREFAREAHRKLGYKHLTKEWKKRTNSTKGHARLRQALRKLDIHPFTGESIKKYKNEQIQKITPKRVSVGEDIMAGFGGLAFLEGIATFIVSLTPIGYASVIVPMLAVCVLLAITSFIGFSMYNEGVERKWQITNLEGYDKPVPAFALQTAMDIKDIYPEAKFGVCELIEQRVARDPFLVVGTEEQYYYYIEVWNEPSYKQEREI